MPIFQLFTNASDSKITKEFLSSTAKVIADSLGKPVNRVAVHVQADQKIYAGDSGGLCGIATLKSVGKLSVEENKKHSTAICGHLNKTLGIPPEGLKIQFIDVLPSNIGTNNTTYHYIFSGINK